MEFLKRYCFVAIPFLFLTACFCAFGAEPPTRHLNNQLLNLTEQGSIEFISEYAVTSKPEDIDVLEIAQIIKNSERLLFVLVKFPESLAFNSLGQGFGTGLGEPRVVVQGNVSALLGMNALDEGAPNRKFHINWGSGILPDKTYFYFINKPGHAILHFKIPEECRGIKIVGKKTHSAEQVLVEISLDPKVIAQLRNNKAALDSLMSVASGPSSASKNKPGSSETLSIDHQSLSFKEKIKALRSKSKDQDPLVLKSLAFELSKNATSKDIEEWSSEFLNSFEAALFENINKSMIRLKDKAWQEEVDSALRLAIGNAEDNSWTEEDVRWLIDFSENLEVSLAKIASKPFQDIALAAELGPIYSMADEAKNPEVAAAAKDIVTRYRKFLSAQKNVPVLPKESIASRFLAETFSRDALPFFRLDFALLEGFSSDINLRPALRKFTENEFLVVWMYHFNKLPLALFNVAEALKFKILNSADTLPPEMFQNYFQILFGNTLSRGIFLSYKVWSSYHDKVFDEEEIEGALNYLIDNLSETELASYVGGPGGREEEHSFLLTAIDSKNPEIAIRLFKRFPDLARMSPRLYKRGDRYIEDRSFTIFHLLVLNIDSLFSRSEAARPDREELAQWEDLALSIIRHGGDQSLNDKYARFLCDSIHGWHPNTKKILTLAVEEFFPNYLKSPASIEAMFQDDNKGIEWSLVGKVIAGGNLKILNLLAKEINDNHSHYWINPERLIRHKGFYDFLDMALSAEGSRESASILLDVYASEILKSPYLSRDRLLLYFYTAYNGKSDLAQKYIKILSDKNNAEFLSIAEKCLIDPSNAALCSDVIGRREMHFGTHSFDYNYLKSYNPLIELIIEEKFDKVEQLLSDMPFLAYIVNTHKTDYLHSPLSIATAKGLEEFSLGLLRRFAFVEDTVEVRLSGGRVIVGVFGNSLLYAVDEKLQNVVKAMTSSKPISIIHRLDLYRGELRPQAVYSKNVESIH